MTKFKIGNKVCIVRVVEKEPGWYNSWSHKEMTPYVGNGRECIVLGVDIGGVDLGLDGGGFGWPHGALETAEPGLFDFY